MSEEIRGMVRDCFWKDGSWRCSSNAPTTEASYAPSRVGLSLSSLPADLVDRARRRFLAFLGVCGGIHLLYAVLYIFVWPEYGHPAPMWASFASMVLIGVSVVALRGVVTARRFVTVAIGFLSLQIAAMAVADHIQTPVATSPLDHVPWHAVLIMMYGVLVPAPPRWIAWSAGGAAAFTVTSWFGVAAVMDTAMPRPGIAVSLFIPVVAMAVVAWVLSSAMSFMMREMVDARELGSYRLIRPLGEGGMGEVWEAEHQMLARPAAIKLIKPELLGVDDAVAVDRVVRRFRREARVTAMLESPHTVELYDFGVSEDGTLYYAMELLDGVDLETLVNDFGPLPPARVLSILHGVSHSLGEAHRAGMIHRDMKPANIYLARKADEVDVVKVLDFGLVRSDASLDDDLRASLTGLSAEAARVGRIQGTPAFIAPEMVLMESDQIDGRADLYSLGCVAVWLLTGEHVFDERTTMGQVMAHASRAPIPPSERTTTPIPADVEALVVRLLQKNRDDRPADARELRTEIERCEAWGQWDPHLADAWWTRHLSRAETRQRRADSERDLRRRGRDTLGPTLTVAY